MSHKSVIACLALTLTYAIHALKGDVCAAKIGLQFHFRNLKFNAKLQNKMTILRADYLTI